MVKYVSLMQVIHMSNWGAFRNVSSVVENSAKLMFAIFAIRVNFYNFSLCKMFSPNGDKLILNKNVKFKW